MASGKSGNEGFSVEATADPASPYAPVVPGARRACSGMLPDARSFPLCALPVQPLVPPHPRLEMLARMSISGVVLPAGRVTAHGADWIICPKPVHSGIGAGGFDEQSLMNRVVRPVAAILQRMQAEQLTHRAIRLENVFVSDAGVELGPFWLTPPAFLQPAVYETPAAASCVPYGRGAGTIADDVYALGVTILAMYLGKIPMAGVPDAEIIERKLWQGSYAALTEGHRIPFALGEIVAAMLADQPSQRPTPERLCRASALTGPAASSRKRVNAAIPMMLAGREVWNAPQLAFLIGEQPEAVGQALELGVVDAWLRRGLNEVVLAERLETVLHPGGSRTSTSKRRGLDPHARPAMLSRIARMLDAEAPLVWDRLRVMPDGLAGLLAGCGSDPRVPRASAVALLSSEALIARGMEEPSGPKRERAMAAARRAMAVTRNEAAMLKLTYELNPTMACASPMLALHPAAVLGDVLPSLELASQGAENARVLDPHLVAFLAARRAAAGLKSVRSNDALAEMRLLASLWTEFRSEALPNLTRRLATPVLAEIEAWPGLSRREARRAAVERAIAAGDPASLLTLAGDQEQLAHDSSEQAAAHERIRTLGAMREGLAAADALRKAAALRFGREGVAVVGAAACAVALLLQVVS